MKASDCEISVVVTSRNDNHAGDMVRRFRVFADNLLEQANRHRLSGELIIVEWNPPTGPRLHEALQLRNQSNHFPIRFIEVPPEAHRTIRNSDVIPLFQMIAKNVGIRRAKGRFVLATNPDLLFSDSLIAFLASGKLDENTLYRIDRYDVPADIPDTASLDEQLKWCNSHVLRVHRKWGSFPKRVKFTDLLRFVVTALSNAFKKASLTPAFLAKCVVHAARYAIRVAVNTPEFLIRSALHVTRLALERLDRIPKIHTNACGDFTLFPRRRWLELRGYPELSLYSLHIDSLLCYMAVVSGLRQRVLRAPAKIFHLEHDSSWSAMTTDQRLQMFVKKPWLDVGLLGNLWHSMYGSQRIVQFNGEDWGFAQWRLNEVQLLHGQKHSIQEESPTELAGVA